MKELEQILQCPITHTPLRLVDSAELASLNAQITEKIAGNELLFLSGQPVSQALQAAFKSANGAFLYLVKDGIIGLLPSLAVVLSEADMTPFREKYFFNDVKQNVQNFYEQIGWQKGKDDLFEDTLQFEETRPVAQEYISRCHRRLKRYLPAKGRYLLDVASGPLQFAEYLEYSENYETRICVDLSVEALKSAQRQLGDRGLYILGDITNLPLQHNAVDAVVSLHTIYHVPKDEQKEAFLQVHRVLKPGAKAVIVYTWGHHSPLMQGLLFPAKLLSKGPKKLLNHLKNLKNWITPPRTSASESTELILYYHPHSYDWFTRQAWPFTCHIEIWRSINLDFMQAYIHPQLAGQALLQGIYALEEKFSRWLGRFGQYPLLIITK